MRLKAVTRVTGAAEWRTLSKSPPLGCDTHHAPALPERLARCQGHVHPVKRHEREKQELIRASNRLTDAILKTSALGLFLLDTNGKIQPQVSGILGALFRRQDFTNLNLEKLIGPLVSAKTLSVVRNYMARLLELPRGQSAEANPLRTWRCSLPNAGRQLHESAHYSLRVHRSVDIPRTSRACGWSV